jgi:peptide-methionine (S)-S-oxide reductase
LTVYDEVTDTRTTENLTLVEISTGSQRPRRAFCGRMRYTTGAGIHTNRKMVSMTVNDGQSVGSRTEIATLGGGCFWCLEAVYDELRGVQQVESGYSGGEVPDPTYRQVCTGTTGHAEVVQVTFDPEVVSFREILEVYFTIHDPTTLNRQGADVGPQYRSAIFYHDEDQRRVAEQVISDLEAEGVWDDPIVTEVTPFDTYYVAEDYHQEYYRNNGYQPYCQVVIAPKVAKFRKQYLERLKA